MSVHRLDIETSGLMVFALNASTQSNLSKQFQKRLVGKRYIALVERAPAETQGAVEAPLIKDPEPTRNLAGTDLQVIMHLQERAKFVPYRNSMMTSVLRDSLGGNINSITSNTPSCRTSPSAMTTQFSVNNPAERSHAVRSTRTVPVKSSM